ncbi:hypothetical protein H0H81_010090, partial [Sphagnurus paluster]
TGTEKCALNEDGSLKDASEIVWYNDKDSEVPIASGSGEANAFVIWPEWQKLSRLHGIQMMKYSQSLRERKRETVTAVDSDEEDDDFIASSDSDYSLG